MKDYIYTVADTENVVLKYDVIMKIWSSPTLNEAKFEILKPPPANKTKSVVVSK